MELLGTPKPSVSTKKSFGCINLTWYPYLFTLSSYSTQYIFPQVIQCATWLSLSFTNYFCLKFVYLLVFYLVSCDQSDIALFERPFSSPARLHPFTLTILSFHLCTKYLIQLFVQLLYPCIHFHHRRSCLISTSGKYT